MKFLGHIINEHGICPDSKNVEKILNWPVPTNVTEVRAILGLGSYYWRFIKDFSKWMRALINLTKKDLTFEWDTDTQAAFDDLKQVLTSPGIMAHPRDDGEFILDTDTSADTIGAVLSQIQDGREWVITYASHTLSSAEVNYCSTDHELLLIMFFTGYFQQYLLGRTFQTHMDHQPLGWLFSLKEPKNRIACWIEALSEFSVCIEYRPGVKHGNADGMSCRYPNPQDC